MDEIDVPVFLRLMLVREGRAVMDFENSSYDHKLRRRKEVTKFIQAIRDGDFSGVKKWEALESVDFSTLQKYGVENLLVVHARQQQTPQPEEESHRNPTSTAPLCPVPDSLLESIRFVQEPPAAKDVTPSVVMDIDLESLSSAGISEQLTSDNVGDLSSAPLPQGAANFRCSTPVLKDSPDLAFLKDLNIPDMEQPSVREVLQFWVVATNTALEHVTLLLKLLKQAGITGIPDTAFWLLNNKELKSVKQNLRKSERIILEKRVKSNGQIVEDRQKIGKFVYFGLREGLLNRSPGMLTTKL